MEAFFSLQYWLTIIALVIGGIIFTIRMCIIIYLWWSNRDDNRRKKDDHK
jgi:hypothetical protein